MNKAAFVNRMADARASSGTQTKRVHALREAPPVIDWPAAIARIRDYLDQRP